MQKAFFVSFEEEVWTLLSNYLDNVEAYLDEYDADRPDHRRGE